MDLVPLTQIPSLCIRCMRMGVRAGLGLAQMTALSPSVYPCPKHMRMRVSAELTLAQLAALSFSVYSCSKHTEGNVPDEMRKRVWIRLAEPALLKEVP